jgi:hypothetical protein
MRRPDETKKLFWERVIKTPEGCWNWLGVINKNGYGQFTLNVFVRNTTCMAHRVSYEIHKGEIPPGYDVHHKCRNRTCTNPEHLELMLHDNHEGSATFGNREKTHCPLGHPYDAANTIIRTRANGAPARYCRRCMELHNRKQMPKKD